MQRKRRKHFQVHLATEAFNFLKEIAVAEFNGNVVVLSNVDAGDPRCPIHGEDAIFTH